MSIMKFNNSFVFLCLLLIITACDTRNTYNDEQVVLRPIYAKGFLVTKDDDNYHIIIRNPSDTTQVVSDTYIPVDSMSTSGKSACFSTTHLAFLDKIGHIEDVVGIPDSSYFIYSSVFKKLNKSAIKEVTLGGGTRIEVLLALRPKYVFMNEFNSDDYATIKSSKLTVLPVLEYLETHPLGRMEWIKFFGFLFCEDSTANVLYNTIVEEYNLYASKYKNETVKPQIADLIEYNGYWYTSGGKSYMAKFYQDAGFDYVWKDDNHVGSFAVSPETAITVGAKTEYMRYVTQYTAEITTDYFNNLNDYYRNFKAVKAKKVIVCNAMYTPYYIEDVVEPDIVLKDFIFAQGGMQDETYTPKYYKIIRL